MNTHLAFRSRLLTVALVATLAIGMVGGAAAQENPQDRLIRGHVALDRGQYHSAAAQFRQAAELAAQAHNEQEQAEALYWQAFALQRVGNKRELTEAAEALLQMRLLEMEESLQQEARNLAVRVKGDLAKQGDAQAARELTEMAEEHANIEEKLMAMQALMQMNPERALPILEQVLADREPGTAELRRQAVFLLSQGGAEGSEELMIDLARNDPDPEVRSQAIFWLGQTGSDEALAFFREVIRTEQDPELVQQAIFALSQVDNAEANAALRDLASDPRQTIEIREQAIFGLGNDGSADDRAFLRALYGEVENIDLKEQILQTAAMDDDPRTAAWLLDIALDPDADMESRKAALFWAGQQGDLPVSRLDSIYTDLDDRDMREQIIFVLSQNGSAEAIQSLMAIARMEDDPELRKQAIFWIGQSGGEGAEEFLLEIINQ